MIKRYFHLIILILILLAGSFFRLYKLNSNPPALFSDEVDAGYQAFVFNKNQSDYYGNKYPTHFHSDSDWRTPLIIYSIGFSQKIFGVNEFSVRFPSAFYGILSIFVFYLLLKIVFDNKNIGLIGAALFSLSPWSIHFSRTAFEVSGMLFAVITGLFFLIKFIKHQKISNLLFALLFLFSSVYFYSTAKLFVFLILFVFSVFYYRTLSKLSKKQIFFIFLFSLLILLPFLIDTITQKSGYRFSYISIFSDPTVSQQVNINRQVDAIYQNGFKTGLKNSFSAIVFHNKMLSWSTNFIKHYLSSFSTNFLFISGDENLRQGFGEFGYFFFIDFFFIIFGLLYSFSASAKFFPKKIILFLFVLLLLVPVPFALTNDSASPHGTRLITMLPFLLFFSSIGIFKFFQIFKNFYLRISISVILFSVYLFCFLNFYHYYFYHFSQKSAQDWHVGIKESILESVKLNYNQVFYSNRYESFLPFFLFWTKYLPSNNSPNISQTIFWINTPSFIGRNIQSKYFFGHLEWNSVLKNYSENFKNTLFIIPKLEENTVKDEIRNMTGKSLRMDILKEIKPNYEMTQSFIFFTLQN